ncbi:MAG: hypothetical protein RMJ55_18925, partial [Roseiflexaceae bacterium]|nr:hypothetical protein [Roseiflexaceae bacterium]
MTHTTRLPGAARTLTLIVALLTALALIPPAPAAASVIRFVALDDTQPEFGAGARTLTQTNLPGWVSSTPDVVALTVASQGAHQVDFGDW